MICSKQIGERVLTYVRFRRVSAVDQHGYVGQGKPDRLKILRGVAEINDWLQR